MPASGVGKWMVHGCSFNDGKWWYIHDGQFLMAIRMFTPRKLIVFDPSPKWMLMWILKKTTTYVIQAKMVADLLMFLLGIQILYMNGIGIPTTGHQPTGFSSPLAQTKSPLGGYKTAFKHIHIYPHIIVLPICFVPSKYQTLLRWSH